MQKNNCQEPHIFRAEADKDQNTLYLELSGAINKQEAEEFLEAAISECGKLRRGFNVINDISQMTLGHMAAVPAGISLMRHLKNAGAKNIVRITGSSKFLLKQALRITEAVRGYNVHYVKSLQEAQELLHLE